MGVRAKDTRARSRRTRLEVLHDVVGGRIVRRGEVWTSTGDYCMNGVTRQKVVDLCRDNKIPVYEKNFSLYEAYGADEAFLTGTFGAQTPVSSIDGKTIGDGSRPLTMRIRNLYKDLVLENVSGETS